MIWIRPSHDYTEGSSAGVYSGGTPDVSAPDSLVQGPILFNS